MEPEAAAGEPAEDETHRLADLGLVAALVAHDLNNVLTVVGGCAAMLRDASGGTPAQARELDELDAGIRHGTELVRQVIAFVQHKAAPEDAADLNGVLARMEWMLRRLGGKSISVDLQPGGDAGRVRVGEAQLERILINLVINARDASAPGGRIVIRTEKACLQGGSAAHAQDLAPGEYARLTVADDGQGMPPEVQQRLFHPFYTTKKAGSGLGLSSVALIVRRCGGLIRVRSAVGSGSTIYVYLPRAIPSGAAEI